MPSTYREYASGSAALAASHLDPSRRPVEREQLAEWIPRCGGLP